MGVLDDGEVEPWDASDDCDSHAAVPDDSPLSSSTALSPCVPPSRAPCLKGLQLGGAASAAAANSRGGSSQPAATESSQPGPGDEAGGAQQHRILRRPSARPLQPWRLTPARRWRSALGADIPSHQQQPGLRPGRQRSAIRPCEESFPCC